LGLSKKIGCLYRLEKVWKEYITNSTTGECVNENRKTKSRNCRHDVLKKLLYCHWPVTNSRDVVTL
jgi:hypothetical protein